MAPELAPTTAPSKLQILSCALLRADCPHLQNSNLLCSHHRTAVGTRPLHGH